MLELGELRRFVLDVWRNVDLKLGLGDVERLCTEPLLLKWSLGSIHFFLTMNLLRFLEVMIDALPWLPHSLFG